ncbi:T9SS type A sorting domain-containing protein [Portibacter marinus]|uniref:T9SS type A sorting domain-containing protein n=1 Tax=Portibacter marinus TaxID=2898660 RepID=UPI001F265000|nr:T9SS type A sorting domain-containing protein [Portibacter marinus]
MKIINILIVVLISCSYFYAQSIETVTVMNGAEGQVFLRSTSNYSSGSNATPTRFTLKIPASDAPSANRPSDGEAINFGTNVFQFNTIDFQGELNGFYYISFVAEIGEYDLANIGSEKSLVASFTFPGLNLANAVLTDINEPFMDGGSQIILVDANQISALLPVELTSFTATAQEETSLLKWQTASEINNEYFDIERSADGRIFEKIGKVAGHGTTTVTQNYEFVDRAPLAGVNYYRLKQVDFNGEYEYTKIETVDFRDGSEGDIKVFPNPTTDFVNITFDRSYDVVTVTNQVGQIVKMIPPSEYKENFIKLNVSDFPNGVYFLEAKLGTELVHKQFVKIR